MQSSPIMALRAVIVLTFMLAVPLTAILSTSFTSEMRAVVFGRKGQSADGPAKVEHRSAEEPESTSPIPTEPRPAPRFEETPRTVAAEPRQGELVALRPSEPQAPQPPKDAMGPPNSLAQGAPTERLKSPSVMVTAVRPISEVASRTSPLWSTSDADDPAGDDSSPQVGAERAATAELDRPDKIQKAIYNVAPQGGPSPAPWQTTAYSTPAPNAQGDPKIVRAMQRLRALGAVHCRLETWGDQGELFRCCCQMSIDGRRLTRHFEATESSATSALEGVLTQVEDWRLRR